MPRKAYILVLLWILIWPLGAQSALINGNFETGNFTGWSVNTFGPQQTLGNGPEPTVQPFDTNGDGVATHTAKLQVGSNDGSRNTYKGGYLSQYLTLSDGLLSFNADIAALNPHTETNVNGGRFKLHLGGLLLDSLEFEDIRANQILRGTLSGTVPIAAGYYQLRLEVTRRFASIPLITPFQFIDNVQLSGPATVPIPSSFMLFVTGIFGLVCWQWWSYRSPRVS